MEQPPPIPSAPPGATPAEIRYYRVEPTQLIPASIKAIAILAIVFGALALLLDTGYALAATTALSRGHISPITSIKPVTLVCVIISFVLGGTLLAGGIGGVRMRPWARKLLVRWSIASLLFLFVMGGIGTYFDAKMGTQTTQTVVNLPGGGVAVVTSTFNGRNDAIAGIVVALLLSIFPAVVLVLWRRQSVIEAFNRFANATPLSQ